MTLKKAEVDIIRDLEYRLSLRVQKMCKVFFSTIDSDPTLVVQCGDFETKYFCEDIFPITTDFLRQVVRKIKRNTWFIKGYDA